MSPREQQSGQRNPTAAELEVLAVLWERGPSTVNQVHEELRKVRDIGVTTVLKTMQIMLEKGLVAKTGGKRPAVFCSVENRAVVEGRLVDDLCRRAFGGSASRLVLRALEGAPKSKEELDELAALIEAARRRRNT